MKWPIAIVAVLLAAPALATVGEGDVVQKGAIRVQFEGALTPKALPRTGTAPVQVAGCPASEGFPGATFAFAKATFHFAGADLVSTLERNCQVRG